MAKFQKGRSGNPRGRPKGVKDKRAALRDLLEPHAPQLVEKAVEMALDGDATALRLCLDRIIPTMPAEAAPVSIKAKPSEPANAGQAILESALAGETSPGAAQQLIRSLHVQTQISQFDDFARRLDALEARLANESPHRPNGPARE